MKQRLPIILASASPRRKNIFFQLGLSFEIIPSNIDEDTVNETNPVTLVKKLAELKALSVANIVNRGIIVGADTIVVLDNEIIGKPKDNVDAVRILKKLSGSTHKVYSGIALIQKPSFKRSVAYAQSTVTMRKLTLSEINKLAKKHIDKAGAYAIQEKNDAFVKKIDGDYYNVVGLPVKLLEKMLLKFGIKIDTSSLAEPTFHFR